jgi:hypothetical protein
MKTVLNPWFLVGCVTWLIVITYRKFGHPLPYINGHINDAFAIPVIADLGLWFQRVVIYKSNHYVLSPWHVVFIVVYVSLVFEGLLPRLSKVYTGDWIDVLLYCIGGMFFYLVMNKPLMEIRRAETPKQVSP